jgi:hypothetical protein
VGPGIGRKPRISVPRLGCMDGTGTVPRRGLRRAAIWYLVPIAASVWSPGCAVWQVLPRVPVELEPGTGTALTWRRLRAGVTQRSPPIHLPFRLVYCRSNRQRIHSFMEGAQQLVAGKGHTRQIQNLMAPNHATETSEEGGRHISRA